MSSAASSSSLSPHFTKKRVVVETVSQGTQPSTRQTTTATHFSVAAAAAAVARGRREGNNHHHLLVEEEEQKEHRLRETRTFESNGSSTAMDAFLEMRMHRCFSVSYEEEKEHAPLEEDEQDERKHCDHEEEEDDDDELPAADHDRHNIVDASSTTAMDASKSMLLALSRSFSSVEQVSELDDSYRSSSSATKTKPNQSVDLLLGNIDNNNNNDHPASTATISSVPRIRHQTPDPPNTSESMTSERTRTIRNTKIIKPHVVDEKDESTTSPETPSPAGTDASSDASRGEQQLHDTTTVVIDESPGGASSCDTCGDNDDDDSASSNTSSSASPPPPPPLSPNVAGSSSLPPTPRTPLYNPYTNYSPQRPRRMEIMGMSSIIDSFHSIQNSSNASSHPPPQQPMTPIPASHHPQQQPPVSSSTPTSSRTPTPTATTAAAGMTSTATSSSTGNLFLRFMMYPKGTQPLLDSDEAVERYAQQIRNELRHAEMVELALEAERAAEAGEERFSAHASTYGEKNNSNNHSQSLDKRTTTRHANAGIQGGAGVEQAPPRTPLLLSSSQSTSSSFTLLPRPMTVRRHHTLAEGTRVPLRRVLTSSKLGVLALRDMHEVVPSFSVFHTHLRTHFARNRIDKTTLAFQETAEGPKRHQPKKAGRRFSMAAGTTTSDQDPSTQQSNFERPMNFLQNLNLKQWVSPRKTVTGEVAEDDDDDNNDNNEGGYGDTSSEVSVGDLLADHQHTPIPGKLRRPRIEVPPGLEVAGHAEVLRPATRHRTRSRSRHRHRDGSNRGQHRRRHTKPQSSSPVTSTQTTTTTTAANPQQRSSLSTPKGSSKRGFSLETTATCSSSEDEQRRTSPFRSKHHRVKCAPRALFDDDYESESEGLQRPNARDASTEKEEEPVAPTPRQQPRSIVAPSQSDFVTPARLRNIRRDSIEEEARTATGRLLLPANSMVESPFGSRSIASGMSPGMPQPPIMEDHSCRSAPATLDSSPLVPSYFLARRLRSSATGTEDELDKVAMGSLNFSMSLEGDKAFSRDWALKEEKNSSAIQVAGSFQRDAEFIEAKIEVEHAPSSQHSDTGPVSSALLYAPRRSLSEQVQSATCGDGGRSSPTPGDQQGRKAEVDGRIDNCPQTPKPTARRVKVSVFGKSPATESSAATLQQSQVVSMESDSDCARVQTPQRDCACLALPPGSPSCDPSKTGDRREDRIEQMRRSISMGALLEEEDQGSWQEGSWNPFLGKDSGNDSGEKSNRSSPPTGSSGIRRTSSPAASDSGSTHSSSLRAAAMTMFRGLSPTKSMFGSKPRRALYVRSRENDDFMNNYLYCSKAEDTAEVKRMKGEALCSEPCHDSRIPCGEVNPGACCTTFLGDAAKRIFPRRVVSHRNLVSLSRSGSSSKVEPESWFDYATERFDGVLEQLSGGHSHYSSPWHISFQAPSLKKQVGPPGAQHSDHNQLFDLKFVDAIDDESMTMEDDSSLSEVHRHRQLGMSSSGRRRRRAFTRRLSVPQPLFEEPSHSLSDNQFLLVYGVSRDQFKAGPSTSLPSGLSVSQGEKKPKATPPVCVNATTASVNKQRERRQQSSALLPLRAESDPVEATRSA